MCYLLWNSETYLDQVWKAPRIRGWSTCGYLTYLLTTSLAGNAGKRKRVYDIIPTYLHWGVL